MNLWSGIAMLAVALLLIWAGRPNKGGHPSEVLAVRGGSCSLSADHHGVLCAGYGGRHFWLVDQVRPKAGYVFRLAADDYVRLCEGLWMPAP